MAIDDEWCRFARGSLLCVYGDACDNPRHRFDSEDPWMQLNDFERDRFGRPLITLPDDEKPTPFTRATTLAKTLDDQYNLGEWGKRMVAYGMTQRRDLVDLAAAAAGPDDKKVLQEVVDQAMTLAGSARAANEGTALHALTQRIDEGVADLHIPEHWRDHVVRYKTLVQAFAFRFAWIEVALVVPDILVAGTADRVLADGRVLDLKTGKSLDFAKVAIAQQLAIYSRAKYRWDGKKLVDAPEMNQSEALVIWLPVNADIAKVYSVDIEQGWELVQTSADVRDIRKTKGKSLFTEVEPSAQPLPDELPSFSDHPVVLAPDADRLEAVKARVVKIVEAGHQDALAALWASDVPTLREGGLTADQLALVDRWCERVEAEKEMSF